MKMQMFSPFSLIPQAVFQWLLTCNLARVLSIRFTKSPCSNIIIKRSSFICKTVCRQHEQEFLSMLLSVCICLLDTEKRPWGFIGKKKKAHLSAFSPLSSTFLQWRWLAFLTLQTYNNFFFLQQELFMFKQCDSSQMEDRGSSFLVGQISSSAAERGCVRYAGIPV